jgi:hypothetical protein
MTTAVSANQRGRIKERDTPRQYRGEIVDYGEGLGAG